MQAGALDRSVYSEFWSGTAGALLPDSKCGGYGGQPSLVLPISATRRS